MFKDDYLSAIHTLPKKEQELLTNLSSDISQQKRFNEIMDLRKEAIKDFNPRRVPENQQIKKIVDEY